MTRGRTVARAVAGTVIAPLAVVAAAMVQFAPVLGGRVYRFEDIAGYFEPLWTAAARAMGEGRLPLWDGGAWSGQPIAGDPQAGIFYPPNWLWLLLPVLRAYAVSVLLHAAWAGLGMYALCRERGRGRGASAAAGISLCIGGYIVLQTRHIMFVQATAWVPWVLLGALRFARTRSRLALAGTAAATGMLLLTGGVSMIYYAAWFLAAVILPATLATEGAPRGARLRCIAAIGSALALGLLLAAPSIVPAAAHGRLSPRALGADEHFAASVAWAGFHYLPSLFVPNLLGQEVRGTYVGGGTQWEIAGYYTGLLAFALAMYALVRGPRERRAERLALAALFALAVMLAPGERSPAHALACRLLPLYGTMRCPPRALYVFSLAVPMLAADGCDLLLQRSKGLLRRSIPVAVPAVLALDLLIAHRAENPSITLAAAHNDAFPEAVAFLRANLRPGERYVNDVHLRHDLHNSGLLWGLESAGGYSSLPLWRYLHLLYMANHGHAYPYPRLHDDLSAQGLWRFGSPIVDLLGVRYVLAPKGWDPGAGGYRKRFDGSDGIDVWENLEALPRAWLVDRGPPGARAARAALLDATFDPRTQVFEEDERGVEVDVGAGRGESEAPVTGVSIEPGGLEARFTAARDALLVMSEPAHPGWRATVDGRDAPVVVADYALTAIEVPAGDHVVRLRMTSWPARLGVALGGLGALCIAAIALSSLLAQRRARRRGVSR